MIEAKEVHYGQYKKYGDSYLVWEITTDMGQEETVEWCFQNLHKRRVPESAEWHKNIRIGGEKSGDYGYYFAGYYKVEKIDGGFRFTVCKPYTD